MNVSPSAWTCSAQPLPDRGRKVLDLRIRQLECLQIRTHDVRYSADLGGCPKLVYGRFFKTPIFSKGFQCHLHADLVAEFETVGHGFCRCVYLKGSAVDAIFLHAKMERGPRNTYESYRRGGYLRCPRFHGDNQEWAPYFTDEDAVEASE